MRLHFLTDRKADRLSGGSPLPTAPPAEQLADGGSVRLTAVPTLWERLRMLAPGTVLVLGGVALGCVLGRAIASLATAIGRALG